MNQAAPTAAQGGATATQPPDLPINLAGYAEGARAALRACLRSSE